MTHDPSTCPLCRWAAEREGWRYFDDDKLKPKWMYEASLDGTPAKEWRPQGWYPPREQHLSARREHPPSFCPSLDAVAGLLKKLFCLGYEFLWSQERRQWYVYKCYYRPRLPEQYFSDDYSCVIEAAMQVLVKEESDGSRP